MIETEQSALVRAPIGAVWDYARDIARWAQIMPGYRECEIVDADNSRWTLKVGVGGLVRTVRVNVHVDEWSGPGLVRFRYKLQGDPVSGSGTYTAQAAGASENGVAENGVAETEISLRVRVEGSGPMAPMWEAMGKPLLPQFARAFADELKTRIEEAVSVKSRLDDANASSPSSSGEGLGWGLSTQRDVCGEAPPPAPPLKRRGDVARASPLAAILAWIHSLWRTKA